jgi:hypothetical protein
MNRVSKLSSAADFAVEGKREALRDRRSRRRREMVLAWARLAGAALSLCFFLLHLLSMLPAAP